MGIDNSATTFLIAAHAAGVSFRRTATLGRQGFFPTRKTLQKLLDSGGAKASADEFLKSSANYAEKFFEFLGAEEVVAIDNSAYEGAEVVADMNNPIDPVLRERFSAVFDGGCLEHVFNFPQAIRNCMEMLSVGGHFLAVTPANNYCGHGFYQFSPELFFRVFSETNGFIVRLMLTKENASWFRVMDPEEYGGRVELLNNRPTCLFVLAQKLAHRDLFRRAPQQSDYVARWEADSPRVASRTEPALPLQQRLRKILPVGMKEALRPYAANVSIRHRYPCYRPMDEQALLRGDFESAVGASPVSQT